MSVIRVLFCGLACVSRVRSFQSTRGGGPCSLRTAHTNTAFEARGVPLQQIPLQATTRGSISIAWRDARSKCVPEPAYEILTKTEDIHGELSKTGEDSGAHSDEDSLMYDQSHNRTALWMGSFPKRSVSPVMQKTCKLLICFLAALGTEVWKMFPVRHLLLWAKG